jgi:hypothetical protein
MATRKELLDLAGQIVKVDLDKHDGKSLGERILAMVAVLEKGMAPPERYQTKIQSPFGKIRILADSKPSILWLADEANLRDPHTEKAIKDLGE